MPQIIVPNQATKLDPKENIAMNAMAIPSFRRLLAEQRRNSHKILIQPCGGLGDIICAEPAIRWALKEFKGKCDIYLMTQYKELFQHLTFKKVFNSAKHIPDLDNFYVFQSYADSTHLKFEFVNHMNTQCVDYASLIMFASQIPDPKDKRIELCPSPADMEYRKHLSTATEVVIHAGKTWQSRTIPGDFWEAVIEGLNAKMIKPILIGAESSDGKGYLDISSKGCVDLRGKLTVMETVDLLQGCKVFLTNDSAPLHMAASWRCWIGFIATAKHPSYVSHWRGPEALWSWRMKNFSKGGLWETMNTCPNNKNDIMLDKVDPELLRSWLPEPSEMVSWAKEKLCI